MGIKLLVDIQPLLRRRTGVGNYIFYLLRELLNDARVEDVVGVSGWRFYQRDELMSLLFSNATSCPSPDKGRLGGVFLLRHIPYLRQIRGAVQALRLKLEWARYHDYVFWGGNYTLPRLHGLKSIVTVYDFSHLHYPEFHPADRVKFLKAHLPGVMVRASAVAVISEATREDLYATLGKTVKLPPVFVVSPAAADSVVREGVRERYALPPQFILSVGTLEPRKNVARLLEAYKQLEPALQAAWPLLLVGDSGWLTQTLAATLAQESHVRWIGYVPDADMTGLYQAAGVFAYVSLFEGFGMPVLEAMTNGVPVLTSNSSSLPEVAGGAAILVNPLSVDDIADSLRTLLLDDDLRLALKALGVARANQFSWQVSASHFLDCCETIR
ncbi:glycosyltransferase family 4 protein [Thiothrix winogradskyi]|uniref:Glycosyltransferase family 4 protein n=1 Tax=Thiothrix winogradskyi TaxID=96472 RepID=A0ABY3T0J9_9GAMM|nr:glycosyltransferase family 1 protein [Thiothrix winogradskyi]UJS24354.1 glycosyltransferase family 4 protein [Thiothrix winogradskyi]